MMHGTSITQSAILTLDNMDRKGLSTIKKDEHLKYEKYVFERATATNISIVSGCLPLSTKYHIQRTMLNIASSSKVKTRDGVINMREAGVNKK